MDTRDHFVPSTPPGPTFCQDYSQCYNPPGIYFINGAYQHHNQTNGLIYHRQSYVDEQYYGYCSEFNYNNIGYYSSDVKSNTNNNNNNNNNDKCYVNTNYDYYNSYEYDIKKTEVKKDFEQCAVIQQSYPVDYSKDECKNNIINNPYWDTINAEKIAIEKIKMNLDKSFIKKGKT